MCYNCGCGVPTDDMGHPDNITEQSIEKASKAMGMTVEESKKEMLKLLKRQLGED